MMSMLNNCRSFNAYTYPEPLRTNFGGKGYSDKCFFFFAPQRPETKKHATPERGSFPFLGGKLPVHNSSFRVQKFSNSHQPISICCQEVHAAIGDLHRAALTRRGLRARGGPRCQDCKKLLMLRMLPQSQGPNQPLLLRLFGNIGSSLVLPVASRPTWGK